MANWMDHPRIRGEHGRDPSRELSIRGSSPHTRGARFQLGDNHLVDGIIPAYAGSTGVGMARQSIKMDHPRIRGEHPMRNTDPHGMPGSSPHTRGARLQHLFHELPHRIIPAYAGSTVAERCTHWLRSDHPRIRGEHAINKCIKICNGRIIPAYAGSTWPKCSSCPTTPDHPRIRGEHDVICMGWATGAGSSPHTRGAHRRHRHRHPRGRIIPAYAGSTTSSAWDGLPAPDHPRIRGEHGELGLCVPGVRGIIPAYAGSTPGC